MQTQKQEGESVEVKEGRVAGGRLVYVAPKCVREEPEVCGRSPQSEYFSRAREARERKNLGV